MLGPAFVDVGNFLGELFLINFFESIDEVYIKMAGGFINGYRTNSSAKFDARRSLEYAAGHICGMALPRRIKSSRSRATVETAQACLDQVLRFITDPEFGYLDDRRVDPIENMMQLMKTRRDTM